MQKILTALTLAATVVSSSAAIQLVAGTTNANNISIFATGPTWDTTPAGSNANVYWDADNDNIFGETGIGENSDNSTTSLDFTIAITSGTSYVFAMEGFGGSVDNTSASATFDILTVGSTSQRLTVTNDATVSFTDADGQDWEAAFVFNKDAYGDVVRNTSHLAGGQATDDQAILTFTNVTAVPEPSSTALLGLGGLALLMRRRK